MNDSNKSKYVLKPLVSVVDNMDIDASQYLQTTTNEQTIEELPYLIKNLCVSTSLTTMRSHTIFAQVRKMEKDSTTYMCV